MPGFESPGKHKNAKFERFYAQWDFRDRMGAPKKEKTVLLRMRVSARLHAYLGYLSRHTIMGASENDVALGVLTERLNVMIESKFHDRVKPPTD